MRIFKPMFSAFLMAFLLNGCGYNQIDTANRLTNTKWYFLDYENDQNIQNDYPQPRTKADYRSQNGCLSGEIEFLEPGNGSIHGQLRINDYCGRTSDQTIIQTALARQQIEYFTNNASGEQLEWAITDNNQTMNIWRKWPNSADAYNTDRATFRVFFSESGNEMIWLFQGQYSRRITWSKNFQPVP